MNTLRLFNREYADVHWLAFVIVWGVAVLPLVWRRVQKAPLWKHQIGNAAMHFGACQILDWTSKCTMGDSVFSSIGFTAFGFGYCVLAIRKNGNKKGAIVGCLLLPLYALVSLVPYSIQIQN